MREDRPGCAPSSQDSVRRRRRAARIAGRVAAVLACSLAFAGCAGKWSMRSARPAAGLQWPYQPARAKVTYVESLNGFARGRDAGSVLRAVTGDTRQDRNGFLLPVAVAAGRGGRIAVADMGARCVHLYLPEGARYLRLTGSKQEPIDSPVGVAFDDESRLYVTDSSGRLYAFAPDGTLVLVLRKAGSEPLRRPTGIAYSPRRKLLFVVDTLANRIHAVDAAGALAFSFGRRGEEPGDFNFPTHVFSTATGELLVTDALNFRVQIFDDQGRLQGSFGRHGDGSGDLAMPKGLAGDRDGIVYVVDSLFDNVQLFDRKGAFLLTVGGRGTGFGEFWLPSGAFLSENGELFVCDTYNRRVQVFRVTEGYGEPVS